MILLQTVERALDVLEIVAEAQVPPTVKEVATRLDLNLSSSYHVVNTLLARRYLIRNKRGELIIGEQIGVLNSSLIQPSGLGSEVMELVRNLATDSGETVYLTRFQNGAVVIQFVAESRHSLRVTGLNIGYSGAEDRRASGKAVLAYLNPQQLAEVTERINRGVPKSSLSRGQLGKELAEIRHSGFAFDEEAYEPGVCCVASPFFDGDGEIAGSVTASAPAIRVDRLREVVRGQVANTATLISNLLSKIS